MAGLLCETQREPHETLYGEFVFTTHGTVQVTYLPSYQTPWFVLQDE